MNEWITAIVPIIQYVLQPMIMNNILLLGFFIGFAIVFAMSSKDPKSPINWTDLLVDSNTKKVSLDKLGQFWGIAISSWVVIYLAQMKEAYSVLPMIFPAYLAFLGGVYTFGKFLKAKDSTSTPTKKNNDSDDTK